MSKPLIVPSHTPSTIFSCSPAATLALTLSLTLTACGGKISSDLPLDDTGTTVTTDGGATDGGTTDAGTADAGTADAGTTTSDDVDGDGWSVEAGDCNDDDGTVYPGAPDDCYDGVDSNCDDSNDNDCDGDSYEGTDAGGDDCDDDNADINPGASDNRANNVDDNCDGTVDEDAYCNVFAPLSNESSSSRTYTTTFFDGTTYTESDSLTGFSSTSNTVTIDRVLDDGAGGGMTISESWGCDTDGAAQVTGYGVSSMGYDLSSVSFSTASKRALAQGSMVEGATWAIDYDSVDATAGTALWSISGTATVLAVDNITIDAGIFATVPVQVTYSMIDESGMFGNRRGVVTWYIAPGLGVIYSEDILDDGTVSELRELTAYSGFFAMDPTDFIGSGTVDTGTADTGTADTGTADTGTADTGTVDSGTADTGTADTGTVDSGTTTTTSR